ncbi:MAG TPA: TonB-dependent receptor, partial [Chitinophagaceae bacterium]|nr:TonB-dependent receptor [Chitinophagaceae bacterium]
NYTNFFPRFSYSLKPKSSQNFRINYNGSTSVPTLDQLQPIKVNTDPLNIFIGNPNLKQSFQHSLNMNFGSYNVLKEKGLWSTLNFNTTQNAFVQSSVVDSVGKRIYQTVNANGNYNLSLYSDFNFKLSKSKIRLGMGPTADINRRIEFLNNIKNITQTTSYGIRVNAGKFVENKYDFNIAPTITFNKSKASINTAANSKYWQLETWASARVYFLKKFELNTNVNLEIRQKDPRFTQNNNYTTWNAGLTKRFFKDNALEVSFSINDILDENRGYSRNFSSYSFTENYYTTLRRFWLVTLRWNISKNGKPASGF